jgi:hypothetical protein
VLDAYEVLKLNEEGVLAKFEGETVTMAEDGTISIPLGVPIHEFIVVRSYVAAYK